MPPNEVDVKLIFTRRRSAKVMGKLAQNQPIVDEDQDEQQESATTTTGTEIAEPKEGDPVRGILVTQQNSSKIVSPDDLSTYTPLRVGSVSSRLHVPYVGKVEILRMFLKEMFRGVEEEVVGMGAGGHKRVEGDDAVEGECLVTTFYLHGGQVRACLFSLPSFSNFFLFARLISYIEPFALHFSCLRDRANVLHYDTFSMFQSKVHVVLGKTKGVATVEWDCSPVGDVGEYYSSQDVFAF